jgi:hypothetical protein
MAREGAGCLQPQAGMICQPPSQSRDSLTVQTGTQSIAKDDWNGNAITISRMHTDPVKELESERTCILIL